MTSFNFSGSIQRHKDIGKALIYASEIQATIFTKSTSVVVSSGAPMLSNLGQTETYVEVGPFKCTWIDADAARLATGLVGVSTIGRYQSATTLAKFWLEDLLVSGTDPYSENYLDRASHMVISGKRYEILGYDRFGLSLTQPYMIAVALNGSFTSNG